MGGSEGATVPEADADALLNGRFAFVNVRARLDTSFVVLVTPI